MTRVVRPTGRTADSFLQRYRQPAHVQPVLIAAARPALAQIDEQLRGPADTGHTEFGQVDAYAPRERRADFVAAGRSLSNNSTPGGP